jgi:hypothetical protein
VDRATSGKTAHLAMTYYYYPVSQCDNSCKLEVGFTVSDDVGEFPLELNLRRIEYCWTFRGGRLCINSLSEEG